MKDWKKFLCQMYLFILYERIISSFQVFNPESTNNDSINCIIDKSIKSLGSRLIKEWKINLSDDISHWNQAFWKRKEKYWQGK